jgi:hypothetical protein
MINIKKKIIKKLMRKVFFVIAIISTFLSCNKLANSSLNDNKINVSLEEKEKQIVANKDSVNIKSIINKFEKNIKLNTNEYRFFSNYIINNNDESFSENTGYLMFHYFLNNKVYCNDFHDYLKTENKQARDKILAIFLQFMCIDLADEKYGYDKLISDFPFFRESELVKKQLKVCVTN